jgi:hypothetical protein
MKRATIRSQKGSKVSLISHNGGYDVTGGDGSIVLENAAFLPALKKYTKLADAPLEGGGNYDYTSTQRSRNRRQREDELAQTLDYPTWRRFTTAAIRGEIKIKVVK